MRDATFDRRRQIIRSRFLSSPANDTWSEKSWPDVDRGAGQDDTLRHHRIRRTPSGDRTTEEEHSPGPKGIVGMINTPTTMQGWELPGLLLVKDCENSVQRKHVKTAD